VHAPQSATRTPARQREPASASAADSPAAPRAEHPAARDCLSARGSDHQPRDLAPLDEHAARMTRRGVVAELRRGVE
jgi:hypothetical protein